VERPGAVLARAPGKQHSPHLLFLRAEGNEVSFSVKLPNSAAEALELPFTEPTQYGLGRHGWVTARVDGGRSAPLDRFESWLEESYRAVAPKRLLKALGSGRPST
jgi:hypothetical protein